MARGWVLPVVAALAALWAPLADAQSLAAPSKAADLDAFAQGGAFARDRNIAVQDRLHPEWEARGLRLGGLTAYPSVSLDAGGTDNLYATPTGARSDDVGHLKPALLLWSERPDRRIAAYAVVDRSAFARHGGEATTDYALGLAAAGEASRALALEAAAGFSRETEPRTSPDSPPAALTPVRYDLAQARLGLAAEFNRLRLSARLKVQDFAFDDVGSVTGGALAQGYRDRTETDGSLRGEFALRPETSVFLSAGLSDHAYRNASSPLADRSSRGARVEVGTSFDSSRLVRGEVAFGYLRQDYRGPFASVEGPSARARVDAFPTPLTTVSLTAVRAVADSAIPSAGGYLASTVKVEVHHELLRNLLLHASSAYEADGYRGIDRQDRRTALDAGLRYMMNRGVVVTARLERETRRSEGLQKGLAYTEDRAVLGVTLRC